MSVLCLVAVTRCELRFFQTPMYFGGIACHGKIFIYCSDGTQVIVSNYVEASGLCGPTACSTSVSFYCTYFSMFPV